MFTTSGHQHETQNVVSTWHSFSNCNDQLNFCMCRINASIHWLDSKHVLNAQVAIRSPCCRQWFDCAECHAEAMPTHKLAKTMEMTFMCKSCRRAFRKDMSAYEESDEYCPHCDNHYVRASCVFCLFDSARLIVDCVVDRFYRLRHLKLQSLRSWMILT